MARIRNDGQTRATKRVCHLSRETSPKFTPRHPNKSGCTRSEGKIRGDTEKRGEGEGSEEICATVEIRGVCRLRRGAKKQRDSFVCKCFLVAVAASTDVSYLLSDKMWLARKRRAYTGSTGHAIKRANLPCILRRSCLNFH